MKSVYIIGLLFICITLKAQVSGVVVDAQKIPILYTNIWNEDASAGATTDIEGKFYIEKGLPTDTLVYNASGFYPLRDIARDTIVLQDIDYTSDELLVYAEKTIKHTLGNAHVENLFFNPDNTPYMMARFFKHTPETQHLKYLNQVIFYAKSIVSDATVKIRLLEVDEYGCPGNDLLLDPIIHHLPRGVKKNKVDIHQYHIKMPSRGVFVAIEWLLTDNNQLKVTTYFKGEELFQDYRYAPDLVSNRVEKPNGYRYMFGEWYPNEQFLKPEEKTGPLPYIDPAIGLILSN